MMTIFTVKLVHRYFSYSLYSEILIARKNRQQIKKSHLCFPASGLVKESFESNEWKGHVSAKLIKRKDTIIDRQIDLSIE